MSISLVRVDVSPNLHVMSLHRQHGAHPLFVLREFDVKVLRHTAHRKKQTDEGKEEDSGSSRSSSPPRRHRVVCGESQFMATGPSEQALRVSIRAAVLRLGLTMEAATAHEIKLLKEADVLGKRAPSASLLTGPDMCHLLRAFGVHNIAAKLARQLETLQPGVMIPCHEDTDVGSRRLKHDTAGDQEVVKKLKAKTQKDIGMGGGNKKDKDIRVKQENNQSPNQSPNQVKRKMNTSQPTKHVSPISSASQPSPAKRPRSLSLSNGSQLQTETDDTKDEQAAGRHVFQRPPSSQPFDPPAVSTAGFVTSHSDQSHAALPTSYTPPTFPQFSSSYVASSHPHTHTHPSSHPFPSTHGYQTTHATMGQPTSSSSLPHANYEHQHQHHQHQHHPHPLVSTHDPTSIYPGSHHESYATYPHQQQSSSHPQQSQSHEPQSHHQPSQHPQQHTTNFTSQQPRQITNYEPIHNTQQHNNNNNNNNTNTTITRGHTTIKQQMGFPSRSPSTSQLIPSSHAPPISNIPPPTHPHNPPPPLTTRIQPITIPSHIPSHVLDSFPVPSPTLISPNPNFRRPISSLMSPNPNPNPNLVPPSISSQHVSSSHIHPSISSQHLSSLRAFSAHPFHKRDTNMCIDMNMDLGELQFPPLCDTQELKIHADISSLVPHTEDPCFSESSSPDMTDTGMESLDNINLEHELDTQLYHQIMQTHQDQQGNTSISSSLELPNTMWIKEKRTITRQTSGNCQTEWKTMKHHGHQPMSIVT